LASALLFFHGERKCDVAELPPSDLLTTALPIMAQDVASPEPQSGSFSGTILDVNGDLVSGATVTLQCSSSCENWTATANDNAAFDFRDLRLGVPFQVRISVNGFKDWTSSAIALTPNQPVFLVTGIKIKIADLSTSVTVYASTAQIATEQVHIEEQQRVLGFIPNFYVVYDSQNAAPLHRCATLTFSVVQITGQANSVPRGADT
jgi:hypothetical protein